MSATLRFYVNGGVLEFQNVVRHDRVKMVFEDGTIETFSDLFPIPPSGAVTIAALEGTVEYNGVPYTNTTYEAQLIDRR